MGNKRATGACYEQEAANYLQGLGYRILQRNFRCRAGEIDLVAQDGEYLVFVEVKYRTDASAGLPQEAVGYKKQRNISRTASYYCLKYAVSPEQPCRFDVAAYMQGEWTVIQNAFDFIPH